MLRAIGTVLSSAAFTACLSFVAYWSLGGRAVLSQNAAGLSVRVTDASGHGADGAVVVVRPESGSPPAVTVPTAPVTIGQTNERFVPLLTIIPVGGSVVFGNGDRTNHHVYSFSPLNRFEMLVPPDAVSAPVVFDRAGVLAIGCNIHDGMIAHLYVADSPWTATTDAEGRARLDGLAPGRYKVTVWHPRLRPGRGEPEVTVDVTAAGGSAALQLTLTPDRRRGPDRERAPY
ncbi:MAG: carboxypeptidase regulatory-like domain-containing protein [Rhodospirillales bacterium]|jgi:plastocyanin